MDTKPYDTESTTTVMEGKQFTPVLTQPDWNNLGVIQRNTLKPRAAFYHYASVSDALGGEYAQAFARCLSGRWKFKLYGSPWEMPDGITCTTSTEDVTLGGYGDILVPGMWQLQDVGGIGPRYTNMALPFPVDPPNVPLFENETGHYVRTFSVPAGFVDHQLRIRFEGVDASFHVYVNGLEIGYSEGSRNPAEFDITDAVQLDAPNLLSVVVYKWCNGTYFEDQDQWWLSGIFRDVHLLAFPRTRIEDFKVETHLDATYSNAILTVDVQLNAAATVSLELLDAKNKPVGSAVKKRTFSGAEKSVANNGGVQVKFSLPVEHPALWTAETPHLYHLVLSLSDVSQPQVIHQAVGFRQVEMKDGVILVNGQRIVFRGTNRHEHHPRFGRAVPYDYMCNDLMRMKQHNINAIRTSHYPNDFRLYDLADKLGFWVMDEADLETHGFSTVELTALTDEERKLSKNGVISLECGRATEWITNKPEYEQNYIDRQRQIVARDKNHPCIIIWSLGNESYHGSNTIAAYNWVRAHDSTRLIHYEGDRDAEFVDMYSLMYPEIPEVMELLNTAPQKKPIILCEYLYGIGNGAGAIAEYVSLYYQFPRLQGGFVWQWASQGLLTHTDEDGKGQVREFYGYGGDFHDVINDGRENTHGYNFSDHTAKPALAELKKAFQTVFVDAVSKSSITLTNRHDFATLDYLRCTWRLVRDGSVSDYVEAPIPAAVGPGVTVNLAIDIRQAAFEMGQSECYIDVVLQLKEATNWAPAGHVITAAQFRLQEAILQPPMSHLARPRIEYTSKRVVQVTGHESTWTFDLLQGTLLSWTKSAGPDTHEQSILAAPPTLGFYRPLTDHDALGHGKEWTAKMLKHVKCYTRGVVVTVADTSVEIEVTARASPPGLEWGFHTKMKYTFTVDALHIAVKGTPFGVNAPKTVARIGLDLHLDPMLDRASWFGRGPGESYRDRKHSQLISNWTLPLDKIFTLFEYPQESGNRTDIRHVTFTPSSVESNASGVARSCTLRADFGNQEGCSFNAAYYDVFDIEQSKHPYELQEHLKAEPRVRLDWAHHGLGTAAIGPCTLPEYTLWTESFSFDITLS